jgi:hypothetical protein
MAATELTTECRAIAERLRAFPNLEGNVMYLRKLIYEDSATVSSLIPVLEAIEPPVEESIVQGLYQAASITGTVGECGGNVAMWPLVEKAADALIAAVDAVEAAAAEDEGSSRAKGRRGQDEAHRGAQEGHGRGAGHEGAARRDRA